MHYLRCLWFNNDEINCDAFTRVHRKNENKETLKQSHIKDQNCLLQIWMVFNSSKVFWIWCFAFLVSEKISNKSVWSITASSETNGRPRVSDIDVFVGENNSFGGGGKLNRNNTYKTEIILFSWELYGSSVTSGQLGILVGSTVWVTTRQWIHCSRVWQNRFHALAVGEFFILLKTYKRYGLLNFIVVIYFRIY